MTSPMPSGPNIPGRGFLPSQWNDATRAGIAAWEAAHPGWIADGSQIGFHAAPAVAPPTPPPAVPPPGGGGPAVPPTVPTSSLMDWIKQFQQTTPLQAMPGASDELSRAYLAAMSQQNVAAMNQATQLMMQDQTNQLRFTELMGQSGGQATDAATRWRQELQAQQSVQNERLRQEQMQMLGYDPNNRNVTTMAQRQFENEINQAGLNRQQQTSMLQLQQAGTLGLSREDWAAQLARQQAAAASQLGLSREDWAAQAARQAQGETAQLGLSREDWAAQMARQQAQQAAQLGLSREDWAAQMARQQSQQGFQGQESQYERQLRLQMQQGEFGQQMAMQQGQFGQQTSERLGQQQFQAGESAAERNLRLQLQSGQLNQQESEYARTYLLQQAESRRQQALLGGYMLDANGNATGALTEEARRARAAEQYQQQQLALQQGTALGSINGQQTEEQRAAMAREMLQAGTALGNIGGNLTEESRSAREQERTQRAALAAQLLQAPKDVFRAGAYFRSLGQSGGNSLLGFGGGVSGFGGVGSRMQGVPGTVTPDDMDAMLAASGQVTAPNAGSTLMAPAAAPAAATAAAAAAPAAPTVTPDQTAAAAGAAPPATPTEEPPGTEPGGPVGSSLASQLGDLGLGKPAKGKAKGGEQRSQRAQDVLATLASGGSPSQGKAQGKVQDKGPSKAAATALPAMLAAQAQAGLPPMPAPQQSMLPPMPAPQAPAAPPMLPPQAQAAMPTLPAPAQATLPTPPDPSQAGLPPMPTPPPQSPVTPPPPQAANVLAGLSAGTTPGQGQPMNPSTPFGGAKAAPPKGPPGMPGAAPGGPVDDLLASQLGDLGMGAGGDMVGRAPAAGPAATNQPIPYVDPLVLEDPKVKAMFEDMRKQGLRNDVLGRATGKGTRPSGPGGPQGETGRVKARPEDLITQGPLRFDRKESERRRNSDERFLLGLSRMMNRAKQQAPGTQPGGPVDAPLWPDSGSGSMPELQSAGSLGGSSFDQPSMSAASQYSSAAPAAAPIGSLEPSTQDAALDEMQSRLLMGVGSWAPQTLERMSKTQRGVAEGATQAMGLNWDDLEEAYAQTRFANLGNVMSA